MIVIIYFYQGNILNVFIRFHGLCMIPVISKTPIEIDVNNMIQSHIFIYCME